MILKQLKADKTKTNAEIDDVRFCFNLSFLQIHLH